MQSKQMDPAITRYNERHRGEGRWSIQDHRHRNSGYKPQPEVDAFLSDILAVCREHGMSLSHEDHHGAFMVEQFSEENAGWLAAAHVFGTFGKS